LLLIAHRAVFDCSLFRHLFSQTGGGNIAGIRSPSSLLASDRAAPYC
jgi:hypothetical protein